jgi:hypothetical protein
MNLSGLSLGSGNYEMSSVSFSIHVLTVLIFEALALLLASSLVLENASVGVWPFIN